MQNKFQFLVFIVVLLNAFYLTQAKKLTLLDSQEFEREQFPLQFQFSKDQIDEINNTFDEYSTDNLKIKLQAKFPTSYDKIYFEPAFLISNRQLDEKISFKKYIRQKNSSLFYSDYQGVASRSQVQTIYLPYVKEGNYFLYTLDLKSRENFPSKITLEVLDHEEDEYYFEPNLLETVLTNCTQHRISEQVFSFGSQCQNQYQLLDTNFKYHFKKTLGHWVTFGIKIKDAYKYEFTMHGLGNEFAYHYSYLNSMGLGMLSEPNFMENAQIITQQQAKSTNDTFVSQIDSVMTKSYLKECQNIMGESDSFLDVNPPSSGHEQTDNNNNDKDNDKDKDNDSQEREEKQKQLDEDEEDLVEEQEGEGNRNLEDSTHRIDFSQFYFYDNAKQCQDDRILLFSFYFPRDSISGEVNMEIREQALKGDYFYFYVAASLGVILVIILIGGIVYVYWNEKSDMDNLILQTTQNANNDHQENNSHDNQQENQNQIIVANQPEVQKKIVYVIVTQNTIEKYMPSRPYEELIDMFPEMVEQEECLICLNKFQKKDMCRMTICLHIFHIECVDVWVKKNGSCPYCRTKINRRILEDTESRKKAIEADPFLKKLIESQVNSVYSSSSDGGSSEKKKMREFDFMYDDGDRNHKEIAKSKFALECCNHNNNNGGDKNDICEHNDSQQDNMVDSPALVDHHHNNFDTFTSLTNTNNNNSQSPNNVHRNINDEIHNQNVNGVDNSYSQFLQNSINNSPNFNNNLESSPENNNNNNSTNLNLNKDF